jgi:dUTP pyrophosphatase
MNIKIKKVHPKAKKPKLGSKEAAFFDIYSCEDVLFVQGFFAKIRTGLVFEVPRGYFLEIRPRSGLASQGLVIPNSPCVIDADYRGEVFIPMYGMFCRGTVMLDEGSKVAQGRIVSVTYADFVWVDTVSETERGEGGFGSTGIK